MDVFRRVVEFRGRFYPGAITGNDVDVVRGGDQYGFLYRLQGAEAGPGHVAILADTELLTPGSIGLHCWSVA